VNYFEYEREAIGCADNYEEARAACDAACDDSETWGFRLSSTFPFFYGPLEECEDEPTLVE
jgi:hypothetical protein